MCPTGIVRNSAASLLFESPYTVATPGLELSFTDAQFGYSLDGCTSFYLSRLPGELGVFLALTGYELNEDDLLALKLIDDINPEIRNIADVQDGLPKYKPVTNMEDPDQDLVNNFNKMNIMENDLEKTTFYQKMSKIYNIAINQNKANLKNLGRFHNFHQQFYDKVLKSHLIASNVEHVSSQGFSLSFLQNKIDQLFKSDSLEGIKAALHEENSEFSRFCLEKINCTSPLSANLIIKLLKQAKYLDYSEVVRREINVAKHVVMNNPDFKNMVGDMIHNNKENIEYMNKRHNDKKLLKEINKLDTEDIMTKSIDLRIKKYLLLPHKKYQKFIPEHALSLINQNVNRASIYMRYKNSYRFLEEIGINVHNPNLDYGKIREDFYKFFHSQELLENLLHETYQDETNLELIGRKISLINNPKKEKKKATKNAKESKELSEITKESELFEHKNILELKKNHSGSHKTNIKTQNDKLSNLITEELISKVFSEVNNNNYYEIINHVKNNFINLAEIEKKRFFLKFKKNLLMEMVNSDYYKKKPHDKLEKTNKEIEEKNVYESYLPILPLKHQHSIIDILNFEDLNKEIYDIEKKLLSDNKKLIDVLYLQEFMYSGKQVSSNLKDILTLLNERATYLQKQFKAIGKSSKNKDLVQKYLAFKPEISDFNKCLESVNSIFNKLSEYSCVLNNSEIIGANVSLIDKDLAFKSLIDNQRKIFKDASGLYSVIEDLDIITQENYEEVLSKYEKSEYSEFVTKVVRSIVNSFKASLIKNDNAKDAEMQLYFIDKENFNSKDASNLSPFFMFRHFNADKVISLYNETISNISNNNEIYEDLILSKKEFNPILYKDHPERVDIKDDDIEIIDITNSKDNGSKNVDPRHPIARKIEFSESLKEKLNEFNNKVTNYIELALNNDRIKLNYLICSKNETLIKNKKKLDKLQYLYTKKDQYYDFNKNENSITYVNEKINNIKEKLELINKSKYDEAQKNKLSEYKLNEYTIDTTDVNKKEFEEKLTKDSKEKLNYIAKEYFDLPSNYEDSEVYKHMTNNKMALNTLINHKAQKLLSEYGQLLPQYEKLFSSKIPAKTLNTAMTIFEIRLLKLLKLFLISLKTNTYINISPDTHQISHLKEFNDKYFSELANKGEKQINELLNVDAVKDKYSSLEEYEKELHILSTTKSSTNLNRVFGMFAKTFMSSTKDITKTPIKIFNHEEIYGKDEFDVRLNRAAEIYADNVMWGTPDADPDKRSRLIGIYRRNKSEELTNQVNLKKVSKPYTDAIGQFTGNDYYKNIYERSDIKDKVPIGEATNLNYVNKYNKRFDKNTIEGRNSKDEKETSTTTKEKEEAVASEPKSTGKEQEVKTETKKETKQDAKVETNEEAKQETKEETSMDKKKQKIINLVNSNNSLPEEDFTTELDIFFKNKFSIMKFLMQYIPTPDYDDVYSINKYIFDYHIGNTYVEYNNLIENTMEKMINLDILEQFKTLNVGYDTKYENPKKKYEDYIPKSKFNSVQSITDLYFFLNNNHPEALENALTKLTKTNYTNDMGNANIAPILFKTPHDKYFVIKKHFKLKKYLSVVYEYNDTYNKTILEKFKDQLNNKAKNYGNISVSLKKLNSEMIESKKQIAALSEYKEKLEFYYGDANHKNNLSQKYSEIDVMIQHYRELINDKRELFKHEFLYQIKGGGFSKEVLLNIGSSKNEKNRQAIEEIKNIDSEIFEIEQKIKRLSTTRSGFESKTLEVFELEKLLENILHRQRGHNGFLYDSARTIEKAAEMVVTDNIIELNDFDKKNDDKENYSFVRSFISKLVYNECYKYFTAFKSLEMNLSKEQIFDLRSEYNLFDYMKSFSKQIDLEISRVFCSLLEKAELKARAIFNNRDNEIQANKTKLTDVKDIDYDLELLKQSYEARLLYEFKTTLKPSEEPFLIDYDNFKKQKNRDKVLLSMRKPNQEEIRDQGYKEFLNRNRNRYEEKIMVETESKDIVDKLILDKESELSIIDTNSLNRLTDARRRRKLMEDAFNQGYLRRSNAESQKMKIKENENTLI